MSSDANGNVIFGFSTVFYAHPPSLTIGFKVTCLQKLLAALERVPPYMYVAYGRNVFRIIILTRQKAGPDPHTLIFCFRGHGRRGGHGGPPQGGSCTQPRALRGPKGEGEAPSPLGIKR